MALLVDLKPGQTIVVGQGPHEVRISLARRGKEPVRGRAKLALEADRQHVPIRLERETPVGD